MIKKTRWRVWTPLVTSFLGLGAYVGVFAWLSSLDDLEKFPRSLTASVFDAFVIGAPGLVLLALCGEAIRSLFWGDYIVPNDRDLRFRINGRKHFLNWERVSTFRVETPVLGQEGVVGWDYSGDGHDEPRVKSSAATTMDGDFGRGWQGGPEAVCIALEAWRSRHSATAFSPGERGVTSSDIRQDRLHLPSILTVSADARKAVFPLIGIWCCFFSLFAFPIWVTALAAPSGRALTLWTSLVGNWSFWLVALLYAAMALWFGYVGYLLTRRFILKPTIVLVPSGFTIRDEAGVRFIRWRDVEAFGIAQDSNSKREHVGWRYRPGVTEVESWQKPSLDMDASLGMGWQGSVHDLRDMFEEWRRRYGAD